MSCSPKTKTLLKPGPPLLKHSTKWSDLWIRNKSVLNNVVLAMKLQSLSAAATPNLAPTSDKTLDINRPTLVSDRTSLLSDELLLQILSRLPQSQNSSNFLVSKRWLNLQGRLVRSLKLLDWNFLVSGRLFLRFPNLTHVDLVQGCLNLSPVSGILLTHKLVSSFHVDSDVSPSEFIAEKNMLPIDDVDSGLKALADRYPNLRRLKVINASEMGLLSVAEECPTLQDLELHRCSDHVLRGIAACQNLQILKLIGRVDGFYRSLVSDIGLTILAQGCIRLVKLELSGCEGSFDGIKAIGQCCQMLEELTLTDHRMDGGWMAALSYCENLKKLKLQSCKRIDPDLAPDEHLGSCPTLECLHLERCQLRDKMSMRALFLVCENVKEMTFHNCWGLEDDMFSVASICREVKLLSLEGCSLLTVQGLENVVQHWMELETLRVVSCNRIKDSEVSPSLSAIFDELKELRWWPDTKSMLVSSLSGTEMIKKRSSYIKFYKKLHQIL